MSDETLPQPAVTLDMCGTRCPAPLLGAKKIVDDLKPGGVLRGLSDCAGQQCDGAAPRGARCAREDWARQGTNRAPRAHRNLRGWG